MRSLIFRGILSATIAFTAACSSTDSVGPATRPTSAHRAVFGGTNVSRSIDQNVWLSCANGGAGEAVRVTGDLRYDVHLTQDSSGVFHLNIKSNTSGLTAVGLPMKGEFDPTSIYGIAGILRENPVDAMHYHTSHAVTLGTLATLIAGRCPAVLTRRVSFSLRES